MRRRQRQDVRDLSFFLGILGICCVGISVVFIFGEGCADLDPGLCYAMGGWWALIAALLEFLTVVLFFESGTPKHKG